MLNKNSKKDKARNMQSVVLIGYFYSCDYGVFIKTFLAISPLKSSTMQYIPSNNVLWALLLLSNKSTC